MWSPRVADFNDGFGGGDEVVENVLFNTCRESADHGPINSWDRQPFLTTVRTGAPSTQMAWRVITRNVVIANYGGSKEVDNDDGSLFYRIHHNFMAYGWAQKFKCGAIESRANVKAFVEVGEPNVFTPIGAGCVLGGLRGSDGVVYPNVWDGDVMVHLGATNFTYRPCWGADAREDYDVTCVGNNTIYVANASVHAIIGPEGVCPSALAPGSAPHAFTLEQYQAMGKEQGSRRVVGYPTSAEILQRARHTLGHFDPPSTAPSLLAEYKQHAAVARTDGVLDARARARAAAARRADDVAARASSSGSRPNLVLFLQDDQDLTLGGWSPMVQAEAAIAARGARATNYVVHTPVCCPSRAQLLSGRYFHNLREARGGSTSGCMHVDEARVYPHSLAARLQALGYTSGWFGKSLNQCPERPPPGWDCPTCWWFANGGGNDYEPGGFLNATFHDYSAWAALPSANGTYTASTAGEFAGYTTSVIANKSLLWVRRVAALGQPFFLTVASKAPHAPFTPAPWYASGTYIDQLSAPRTPPYNASHADLASFHELVAGQIPISAACERDIDANFRNRLRSLLSVDDAIGALASLLDELGLWRQTYFIVTSDHGYNLGQHRLPFGKHQPCASSGAVGRTRTCTRRLPRLPHPVQAPRPITPSSPPFLACLPRAPPRTSSLYRTLCDAWVCALALTLASYACGASHAHACRRPRRPRSLRGARPRHLAQQRLQAACNARGPRSDDARARRWGGRVGIVGLGRDGRSQFRPPLAASRSRVRSRSAERDARLSHQGAQSARGDLARRCRALVAHALA